MIATIYDEKPYFIRLVFRLDERNHRLRWMHVNTTLLPWTVVWSRNRTWIYISPSIVHSDLSEPERTCSTRTTHQALECLGTLLLTLAFQPGWPDLKDVVPFRFVLLSIGVRTACGPAEPRPWLYAVPQGRFDIPWRRLDTARICIERMEGGWAYHGSL